MLALGEGISGYYNVGQRQAAAGTALDLFVVIFLILMIWKPGL